MRLTGALAGDLERLLRQEAAAARSAVTLGVTTATDGLKSELRGQVTGAGLGTRIARAWRGQVYPPRTESIDAAGFVFSKAPAIIRAFDEGATIRSRAGLWLAIPTEAAPRRGVGGRRISPSTFPEHRFGRLRFVYRRGAPSLLVVDGLRASGGKRGGFRRASATALRTGRGLVTVVMFVLVPQVSLKKRLDVTGAHRRWADRLPDLVLKAWPEPGAGDPP